MGSSPLMGWSPYVKFMVISSQDDRKVAAKSPFKINRELVKILGAESHGVTKQRSGDLMVELRSKEQERKLERVPSFFLDIPVTVREAIPPYRGGKNLPRVPWFNEDCKQAILERKRAQRKYFKHPTLLNFINFKKAKDKSKFTIK